MKKNINIFSDYNIDVFYNFIQKKINQTNFFVNKPQPGNFNKKIFNFINSKKNSHLSIIWTKADEILSSFNKILNYEKVGIKELHKEINTYIELIKQLSLNSDYVIVFSWTLPVGYKSKILNDFSDNFGIVKNLNLINNIVAKSLKRFKNIFFINSEFVINQNNIDYDPKYWFLAKIPFSQQVFENASDEILKILHYLNGKLIKLIIVDLDNTLWGGNLGDRGWQKITLGGHDTAGEAFIDFQKKLKALKNLGIQLAISSKNDEKNALNAIQNNENMVLKKKDFISWKINWEDKAKNIKVMLKQLNLSPEQVIFLDDNIRERERVRKSIKNINVPDLPDTPFLYSSILMNYGNIYFAKNITKEDRNRTRYYQDNSKRLKLKEKFLSEKNWLKSLKTKINFKKIDKTNIARTVQLFLRVNQMNLTTRRLSEQDLIKLNKDSKNHLFCCDLKDKFGNMGIIGFFNLEIKNDNAVVRDLILSCRAFGRGVEHSMIFKMIKILSKKKISKLELNYFKTKKNKPCLEFLKNNFKQNGANRFVLNDFKNFKLPDFISLTN